jgi:hypothetical protein
VPPSSLTADNQVYVNLGNGDTLLLLGIHSLPTNQSDWLVIV